MVKIVNGAMTRTLWAGAEEIGQYDAAGALIRRIIPDGSGVMDQRLAVIEADGSLRWLLTDHLGSVIATTDATGGDVSVANYSPHGELGTTPQGLLLTAPPKGSPFGFTGREWDPETGLYHYRARAYAPWGPFFLSTDPMGSVDDPNLYMYVGNDPVNATDPTGMCPNCIGAIVGAGTDYVMQVGSNLAEGESLRSALTNVDGRSIAASGALGAIGGPLGGQILKSGARGLSIVTKGKVGEGLTRVGMALRGERVLATNQTAKHAPGAPQLSGTAGRSRPDFTVVRRDGRVGFVESKFGHGRLSNGQMALQREVGDDAFRVSRTSYTQIEAAGAVTGGSVAGAGVNCVVSRNSSCRR